MDWIELEKKIADTEYWLHINEHQMSLPLMCEEDVVAQQEVRHKKEILDLCNKFKQQIAK